MVKFQQQFAGAAIAGFTAFLISYAGSVALVFQAATAAGASPAQIASWLLALGLGIGATCIGLSIATRMPVLTGWSTPGAAMLATSLVGVSMSDAVGAFAIASGLMLVLGLSGQLDRVVRLIPRNIASAMLAGVVFRFVTSAFASLSQAPMLVGAMLATFFIARVWWPKFASLLALLCGLLVASWSGLTAFSGVQLAIAVPLFTAPSFSGNVILGVALPLFVVTLASQNLAGLAVLKGHGYDAPPKVILGWTGLAGTLLAPFGAFSINIAAITAALCMSKDVDPDPARRYRATVWAGVLYLLAGVLGATVATLLSSLPQVLIVAFTGIALLGTLTASLKSALDGTANEIDASIITFALTASGLVVFGVGSALWGLLAGLTLSTFRRSD